MLTKVAGESHGLWQRIRPRLADATAFSAACKLLGLAILAPIITALLRLCLQRWGRAAAGNFDIAAFLLAPEGMLALALVSSLFLVGCYFELAGLMRLLWQSDLSWRESLRETIACSKRLFALAVRQLAFLLPLAIPFLAGVAAAYLYFWHGRDLNGL